MINYLKNGTLLHHPCDYHLQVLDTEVAWFFEVQMSCIVIIVEVGPQRPELLGKVALLVWLSIHPKTNFAMPKPKN